MKKIAIIGSGPAGCTAALYLARAGMEATVFTGDQPGGQLDITTDVENYPGFVDVIMGPDLMLNMRKQAEKNGAHFIYQMIDKIEKIDTGFCCHVSNETQMDFHAVIIATGARAKFTYIDGEQEFLGRGVSACATCDGPLFKNKRVIVIGGGNTAVTEALHLSELTEHVILIHRRDSLRAEHTLQQRMFNKANISFIWNTVPVRVEGDKKVKNLVVLNQQTHTTQSIDTDGIFIAIGHAPSTSLVKDMVELDQYGYIQLKNNTTHTSMEGIFAAGDVHDHIYRQAVTAAGYGCMAAIDVAKWLSEQV